MTRRKYCALSLAILAALLVSAHVSAATTCSITLDRVDNGKQHSPSMDVWSAGVKSVSTVADRSCWTIAPANDESKFIYVKITAPALIDGSMRVAIKLHVWDDAGRIELSYDSYLFPWKQTGIVKTNTCTWKEFTITLDDATFLKRCNGADFRITSDQKLSIDRIDVILLQRKIAPDSPPTTMPTTQRIARLTPDTIAMAHPGIFWGPGGMTREMFIRELDLMKQHGFGWLRYWPEWAELEPVRGEYHWEQADTIVAEAKKRGIKIIGMIGYGCGYGADAPADVDPAIVSKYPPKNLSDLQRYVTACVSRYKNDVHHWEGWNEMNATDGFWRIPPSGRDPFEHYVALQRVFYRAAKQADPSCTVLTGGLADMAELGRQLARYYANGLKGTFDVMNIHLYGKDPRDGHLQGQLLSVTRVMKHFGDGDKKIYITETGWPVEKHQNAVTLEQQAQWTPDQFAVLLSYPQIERVCFYTLRDAGSSESFGWYDPSFTPRPVVKHWQDYLKANAPEMLNR